MIFFLLKGIKLKNDTPNFQNFDYMVHNYTFLKISEEIFHYFTFHEHEAQP